MRGILSKTEKARIQIDILINKVVEVIKKEKEAEEEYRRDMEEYNRKMAEWEKEKEQPEFSKDDDDDEESDLDDIIKKSLYDKPKKELNYSEWSQADLNYAINKALDDRDFELMAKLSKHLKKLQVKEGLNPTHKIKKWK